MSENQSFGDSPTRRISVNWRQTHYKSCSQNSRQPPPTRVVSDKTHFPRGWRPTPASAAHSNRAVKRTTIPFCPYAQHNAKRTLSRSPTEGRRTAVFFSQPDRARFPQPFTVWPSDRYACSEDALYPHSIRPSNLLPPEPVKNEYSLDLYHCCYHVFSFPNNRFITNRFIGKSIMPKA